ncbi:MAG: hypothetical protein Q7R49_01350 [Candidatus Daviesbacteria bacterium]|nr:hypothetical protein [Candidatus Daviesbacteria bacterium]
MKDILRNIGRVVAFGGILLLPACGNTESNTCTQGNKNGRVQLILPLGKDHPLTGTLSMEFDSRSLTTGTHQVALNQFSCPSVLALFETDQETADLLFSGRVYPIDPKIPPLKWGSYRKPFDYSKSHRLDISWSNWNVDKIVLDKGSETESVLPNLSGGSIE